MVVSAASSENRRSPLSLCRHPHGSNDMNKYFKTSCTQHERTCSPNTHFVYLKWLIKTLLLLVLARSCRVHGDPAATISRVSWLSCDWIQLHRATTDGWWRADAWLNASNTIRPDVCFKAAVEGPASPLDCRYSRTPWVLVVHWHHLKGLSQPEAFYCLIVWRRFEPIPFGLSHHLHMHIHVEYITGRTGCGLKG